MRQFEVGQRVYTVAWNEQVPYILSGKVALHGPKRPQKRVQCGGRLEYCQYFEATIEAAINKEAERCLHRANGFFDRRPYKPWTCLRELLALKRLYTKLKKHHLVGVTQ